MEVHRARYAGHVLGDSTYSDDVFGGLELPEGDVDGDTTFTLSL